MSEKAIKKAAAQKAKKRAVARATRKVALEGLEKGEQTAGKAAAKVALEDASDVALEAALETGTELMAEEALELAAKEAVVGEISAGLAATGVGAPLAGVLEAGMQIYAVGDAAFTIADVALETGLADAAVDAAEGAAMDVIESAGSLAKYGSSLLSMATAHAAVGIAFDLDIIAQMTTGTDINDAAHMAYHSVKKEAHAIAQTASTVGHHVHEFFTDPAARSREIDRVERNTGEVLTDTVNDPTSYAVATIPVVGVPTALLMHTDAGKRAVKSVDTAAGHVGHFVSSTASDAADSVDTAAGHVGHFVSSTASDATDAVVDFFTGW
jgi:hypothetical protein